jgi:hypothetical protein
MMVLAMAMSTITPWPRLQLLLIPPHPKVAHGRRSTTRQHTTTISRHTRNMHVKHGWVQRDLLAALQIR